MVVDWYDGHLVCAEYARTQTDAIAGWLVSMADACARVLEVPPEKIHLRKRRTRPAEGERYQSWPIRASGSRCARTAAAVPRQPRRLPRHRALQRPPRDPRARARRSLGREAAQPVLLHRNLLVRGGRRRGRDGERRCQRAISRLGKRQSRAQRLLRLVRPTSRSAATPRAYLNELAASARRFTLCVLDPPSFSTRDGEAGLRRPARPSRARFAGAGGARAGRSALVLDQPPAI